MALLEPPATQGKGTVETLAQLVRDAELNPPEYRKQIRHLLEEDPQSFLTAAVQVVRTQGGTRGAQFVASLLASTGLLLPALCDPSLSHDEALSLARLAMRVDSARDVILGRDSADRVASSRIIRTLERSRGGKEWLPQLLRLFRQPNPYLRSKAVLLLGRDTRNVTWVRKILADADPRIRANAVEAIWGVDRPEARELFQSLQADPNNRVAGNALLGLYQLGDTQSIPGILQMAAHQAPAFRATAAWVMGEVGHPRFNEALSGLLKDPDAIPRRAALAAFARLNRAAAQARELPVRRLAARVLRNDTGDGTRRVSLAVANSPGRPTSPILPTQICLTEDGNSIHHYRLIVPAAANRARVVFVLPSADAGSGSLWSRLALQCLDVKRPEDAWSCVSYASGVLESAEMPHASAGLRFHTEESAIREDFQTAPLRPTRADVWTAMWRAIECEIPGESRRPHLIVCNDSLSDRTPGAGLIARIASSGTWGSFIQVVSSVPNAALKSTCREIDGTFRVGRTPAALAALIEESYLRLQTHYEVIYQRVGNAKVLKLALYHPGGWGETSIALGPGA